MRTDMLAGLMAGFLGAVAGAAAVHAGAGQAAGRAASGEMPSARTATTGYGQSFDWHRPVTLGPKNGTFARATVVLGKASWVCTVAGAGSGSQCRAR
jgi:hypothetical protein